MAQSGYTGTHQGRKVVLIRRMLLVSTVAMSAAAYTTTAAIADEPSEAGKVAQSVVEVYMKLYDSHDSKALSMLFVPDGVFLPPNGSAIAQGREALERSFAELFMNVGGRETINIKYATTAGRDAVVAITEFRIVGDGQNTGKIVSGRASITLVRTPDGWRYVSIAPQTSAPPR